VRNLGSLREIVRLDRSAFSISTGLRGATFTTTPLIIGLATGNPGAVIAVAITLEISNLYILAALLFGFYTLTFATRGVNLGLVQVFLTPSIIILLNILYPGQWQLAESRVLDVVIGGAIAVTTVYLLGIRRSLHNLRRRGDAG
jgi:uncharacterized membrane protein YccC